MSRDREPPGLSNEKVDIAVHGAVDAFDSSGPVAFDDFYRSEYRSLVGLAYALCGNATASEELVQDAFIAAYQRWDDVSAFDRPDLWIRTVLVNRTRSWGRRRSAELRAVTRLKGRRQTVISEMAEPDHEFWDAVRSLPKRQAQAIALHYLEDRPVDEIATILDCASGTVKSNLFRGRSGLSRALSLTPPEHQTPEDDAADDVAPNGDEL